jgi:hypothetical protein
MKKIVKRKIGYGFGILLILSLNIFLQIFIHNFNIADKGLIQMSYLCGFGSLIVIILWVLDFLKNSEKVKTEKIIRFNNQIKLYEKEIEFCKNEINKINNEY